MTSPRTRAAAALLVCLSAPMTGTLAQEPAAFDAAWAETVALWEAEVERSGIVGSSLAFLDGGRLVRHEVRGLADEATGRAVDANTIYHWASITKTFTGIAILQLRDAGLLSLDDPILDHVPELSAIYDPDGDLPSVTLRHLLSHSAGFRAATFPWGGSEPWHPHEPTEWSQLVAMFPYTRLHFRPGERYSYSNPGIVFLGQVIERLAGEDYEVYVDKHILQPLGMERSYFDQTPPRLLPDRSDSWFVRDGVRSSNGLDFDTGITVSNGGLNAPIPDMARYLAFLVGDPERQAEYDAVLKRSSLEEMWRPVVPVDEGNAESGMGLTFFRLEDGGLSFVGHTGQQMGFISFFCIRPESRTAAIGAFNTLGLDDPPRPDTRAVQARVRSSLMTRVFPLFEPGGPPGR